MITQKAKRFLSVTVAAALACSVMPWNTAFAQTVQPIDNTANLVDFSERRDFSKPSDEKHAYSPFAKLEDEKATEEYRKTVEYTENKIVYKQTEKKSLFRSATPEADRNAIEKLGVDVDSAKEINRTEVDSGLFSSEYEVTYAADLDKNTDVWETVDALSETDGVVDAQPEYLYRPSAIGVPDGTTDKDFNQQWYGNPLHIQQVWGDLDKEGITPGAGTVVAVIDTGVDYTHPDLAANMWINTAELNGVDGVDDDGNGYVDDIYGASTVGGKYDHNGNPMDDHGHGTHVAGIIGMTPNNHEGGAGLAYGAKIMAVKAGQATGIFADTDIAEAIKYAASNGADVINMSFGGYGQSFLIEDALKDAFGKCVLVAAAGNDDLHNILFPFYPASYPYVLGVMASDHNREKAVFSNWEAAPNYGDEYEVIAPGVDIFSTLPGGQYAKWSGTSMSAPMVSAAAALLRSKYTDREMYSSRFIMGQLASATDDTIAFRGMKYVSLNISDSLYKKPKPNLIVKSSYLFDSKDIVEQNDGDGIVDAGEIIDLGLVLRNQWGMASDVTVKVDALSPAGIPHPSVEFINDTIEFENIGTFNEQNNSFVYKDDILVGTDNPIRFKINESTINDTNILLNIRVTAKNALDKEDTTVYSVEDTISFFVQKGRIIRGKIKEDLTMTKDDYWIVENGLFIPKGVTVKVEPGTQIQFWTTNPEDTYVDKLIAYIAVEGDFIVEGTEQNPVEMFPSITHENYGVEITSEQRTIAPSTWYSEAIGNVSLSYVSILNPLLHIENGDHLNIVQNNHEIRYDYDVLKRCGGIVLAKKLSRSNIQHLRDGVIQGDFNLVQLDDCYFDAKGYNEYINKMEKNVFLSSKSALTAYSQLYSSLYNPVCSSIIKAGNSKYAFFHWDNIPSGFGRDEPYSPQNRYEFMNTWANIKGGTLACINSQEEFELISDFVAEEMKKQDTIQYSSFATIGYQVNKETGDSCWLDGTEWFPDNTANAGQITNGKYEYYPFGTIEVIFDYADTPKMSRLASFPDVSHSVLLEFPDCISDEIIMSDIDGEEFFTKQPQYSYFSRNAILNPLLKTNMESWMVLDGSLLHNFSVAQNNYWGTENEKLVQKQIVDFNDYINKGEVVYSPYLTLESPELENIYPFVTEAYITDTDGNRLESVGHQDVQLHVKFNRDMAEDIMPLVSYGPDEPYTDYIVDGEFVTPREWVGETTIKSVIDAGTEFIRVKGAAAADDKWLKTGTDWGRFAFEVSLTGAQSMNLQGEGLENKVRLSWIQDDYDLLAGYNVYRAESENGEYTKINTRIIPGTIREFTDTNVEPGKDYWYYFTVSDTSLTESKPSNIVKVTPVDNIKPTLNHMRVERVKYGEAVSFNVTATDNIGVDYVNVYYRAKGAESWKTLNLSAGENNSYFGVVPANEISRNGMEYYVEVSDGTSVARDGSEISPIEIAVDSKAAVYGVSPSHVSVNGGETAVITGINFTDDMTLTVGEKAVECTIDSDKQITFTVPAGDIGRADILLTDAAGVKTRLPNALYYEDANSEAQIVGGTVKARESVRLPITVGAVGDLYAFTAELKVDGSKFSSVTFEKSENAANAIADYNYMYDGRIKVSVASTETLPNGEPIGYLVLTANDISLKETTSVNMTYAEINGVALAKTIDGAVTIVPNFTISGSVRYYGGTQAAIDGVKIGLTAGGMGITGADGSYSISGITTGRFAAIPELTGRANGAVTAQDASLVMQSVVEKITLNELQAVAADVNGDGEVNAMDASYILQKAVGKIAGEFPGSGKEWTFAPESRALDLTSNSENIDFTAILLGDVSGDWQAADVGEIS